MLVIFGDAPELVLALVIIVVGMVAVACQELLVLVHGRTIIEAGGCGCSSLWV